MIKNIRSLQKTDAAYHLHPFSDNKEIAEMGTRVITDAKGIFIYDGKGAELLDAMSGLWCVNLGYSNRRLTKAATTQLKKLPYYNHFFQCTTSPATELSKEIVKIAPKGMKQVFYTSSGSEANDTALKLIWRHFQVQKKPKKRIILTRNNAYHGSTVVGASLGGMKFMHDQIEVLPYIQKVDQPYWFEEGRSMSKEDFGIALADSLEKKIKELGADSIAAFFAEPIQGAGGVIIPPDSYWPHISKVLKKHNILLVADEVITGFGRLGDWFASTSYKLDPDLIIFAKAITSGYIPLGGVIVGKTIAASLEKGGDFNHGYTYSGHPVACATGLAVISEVKRLNLLTKLKKEIIPLFEKSWRQLADHPIVGETRSKGMMAALELVANKKTGKRLGDPSKTGVICRTKCLEAGLVMRSCGGAMVVAPPLIITKKQITMLVAQAWQALDATLSECKKQRLL